jgi:DNA-binding NarL/FixJ family response regulator
MVKEMKGRGIRVLVAEDHPVVADGIVAILANARDIVVVGRARDGAEAIDLLQRYRPDIVLLDLRMPVVDGIGVARWIKSSGSTARAIILTSFQSESDISQAIQAGAKAYLLKDTPPAGILKTIRRVHRGEVGMFRERTQEFAPHLNSAPLKTLDLEILGLILRGHDNRAIGLLLGLPTDAVKYHLRGLFSRLGVKRRAAAARQAMERGLVRID